MACCVSCPSLPMSQIVVNALNTFTADTDPMDHNFLLPSRSVEKLVCSVMMRKVFECCPYYDRRHVMCRKKSGLSPGEANQTGTFKTFLKFLSVESPPKCLQL